MTAHGTVVALALTAAVLGVLGLVAALGEEAVRRRPLVGAAGTLGVLSPPLSAGVEHLATGAGLPVALTGLLAAGWAARHLHTGHPVVRVPRRTTNGPVEPLVGGPRPLVSVLPSLTTPALCREWLRSLVVLRAVVGPAALDDVSRLRRRYLDELERRDPAGFARWLDADTGAAGHSPEPYLSAVPREDRTS